jgi:site-specific DNA-adenine methylase
MTIRDKITKLFPVAHDEKVRVISPFFGGGSLELALLHESWCVQICANDLFAPLINFWQVAQSDRANLCAICRARRPVSREKFMKMRARLNVDTNRTESAADYFAINRSSFNGAAHCGGFYREAAQKRFNANSIARLRAVDLTNITFSCEDALAFIPRIFREPDIMYLDPPYYGAKYSHCDFDHVALRDLLRELPSKRWIMSYGDCPYIRELYDADHFKIKSVSWSYCMTRRESSEILIYPRV